MFYELPDIIFTVNLEPSLNTIDENNDLVEQVDIQDLEPHIQTTIVERINLDYLSIISNTISPYYKIAAYKYNESKNLISMDFILTPEDIKKNGYQKEMTLDIQKIEINYLILLEVMSLIS